MDPLSVTASIIAVLQLTTNVISYINDVKNAPKELSQFAIEASSLYALLTQLKYRVDDSKSSDAWFASVRAMGASNGPFDQYKMTLEKLQRKLTKKHGGTLLWPFIKDEIVDSVSRIERMKSLVNIALELDHL